MSTSASQPEHLERVIARAREVDGQPPFSDQSLVELARGERTLVEATNDARVVGAAIVGADDFELVVDPDARAAGVGTALLERVLADHPTAAFAWAHGDHPASRALAARFGFEAVRTLLQLRTRVGSLRGRLRPTQGTKPTPLPEEVAKPASRREPTVDSFRPGIDDTAWLDLNARAFARHPEQGGLTQGDLDDRKAEDWFDAEDFVVLRDGESMIGFCWLKVEASDDEDRLGEFYAVGIDPLRQGEGLARVLMDAGFARLDARGIRTATLYVEADNEPALALYRRYGFAQHTIDVRYRRRTP